MRDPSKRESKKAHEVWRFFGVCAICGWTTPPGTSWIITGNSVAGHVGREHPETDGLVGYFYRKRVTT